MSPRRLLLATRAAGGRAHGGSTSPARIRRGGAERGTSAVEYGLLVVSIAAVVTAIVFSVGVKLKDTLGDTCRSLTTAQSDASGPGVAKLRPVGHSTGCNP